MFVRLVSSEEIRGDMFNRIRDANLFLLLVFNILSLESRFEVNQRVNGDKLLLECYLNANINVAYVVN